MSCYSLTTRDKNVDDQWFPAVCEPHEVYPQRYGLQDRHKETCTVVILRHNVTLIPHAFPCHHLSDKVGEEVTI